MNMKRHHGARVLAGAFALLVETADAQTRPDAVYVTPLPSDESSMAQPASVLRGDELRRRQASSLGDTLDREPGVHSGGMGPGASRPVIRGQDAPRVRVLDNGVGSMDASSISPDHMPAVETLGASQVEILRGPATLLYGGGAIGGLVNVVSKRIPVDRMTGFSGAAEFRGGGAAREGTGLIDLNGGSGALAWHLDAYNRHANDYRIKGAQIPSDPASPTGRVPNSFVEATGASFGASFIGDRGFLGASLQALSTFYGIPAGEQARIDLNQTRLDVAGELRDPLPGVGKVKLRLGRNDYRHDEVEQSGDIATRFRNRAHEGRLELQHLPVGRLNGVLGVSFQDRRFSAVGAESFLPPVRSEGHAVFLLEELRLGQVRLEFGGRAERERHRPDEASGQPARSFGLGSWSGGAVWEFRPGYNAGVSVTGAQRAPAIEELYANGPHAGTASFEAGDANLRRERSRNLDFSLRKTAGVWRWKASAFVNRFRNYIFAQRQDVDGDGAFDPALDRVDDTGAPDPAGEFFLVNYRQADARFRGFEAELAYRPESGLGGRVFADAARGRLIGADNVARMAPSRLGFEARYLAGPWQAYGTLLKVFRQDRIAVSEETATPGYTRLDAGLSYRIRHAGERATTVFLQANNLLNEDMRVHTSFIKDSAPLAGRGLVLGLRSNF
jgi:iron complex outermembrane receptor protein